jgi:hypothetical protein
MVLSVKQNGCFAVPLATTREIYKYIAYRYQQSTEGGGRHSEKV